MGKALYEQAVEKGEKFEICSMYDAKTDADDNLYFPAEIFSGYGIKKMPFIRDMVRKGMKKDVVILSHINLLMVGWLIKKVAPSTKVILLAHGIEIWDNIGAFKRKMLNSCDLIISVSNYTRENIIRSHDLQPERCTVLNNCLDPFLPLPSIREKDSQLLEKYHFAKTDKILMTLTRLSSKERYKGYDKVISAVAKLKPLHPGIKYLIAGSYDAVEKKFLDEMITELGLQDNIVMAGYVKDEELEAHFALADVYVMPSRKEGFGIVFIEAMYYGLPVIAGNRDGSVDALSNGELGLLVNPTEVLEITSALESILQNPHQFKSNHTLLMQKFGYNSYKNQLLKIMNTTK